MRTRSLAVMALVGAFAASALAADPPQGRQTDSDFAASYKVPEKYTGYPAAQAASVKNASDDGRIDFRHVPFEGRRPVHHGHAGEQRAEEESAERGDRGQLDGVEEALPEVGQGAADDVEVEAEGHCGPLVSAACDGARDGCPALDQRHHAIGRHGDDDERLDDLEVAPHAVGWRNDRRLSALRSHLGRDVRTGENSDLTRTSVVVG